MGGVAPALALAEETPGDQLARTLFELAGTLAQARYAAARVADPQLGRAMRRLIASGEAVEDLLRRRMAAALGTPTPSLAASSRWVAGTVAAAIAAAGAALAATAYLGGFRPYHRRHDRAAGG